MTVEPFKRITKVTQETANKWQKYYVCMYRAERVKTPFCGVILESRGDSIHGGNYFTTPGNFSGSHLFVRLELPKLMISCHQRLSTKVGGC